MELIKIQEKNGQQVVSARELHSFLEINTQFTKWAERMFEYGFIENVDYIAVSQKRLTGQGNETEYIDYAINFGMAKELAMIQRTDKGKEARLYFIECERKLQIKTPQTYIEALKALVVSEEQKMLLTQKVDNLETALDSLVEWVSIIKVCQFNKIKNEKAFDWHILKAKSATMGYSIKRAESARYGYQNLYHVNVFKACYPKYDYNFINK